MSSHHLPLSATQMSALAQVKAWLENDTSSKRVFRLFGYAGTGKTTLAKHVAALVDNEVVYVAYTGKAASVMQQNGCEGARTLHSLIYTPMSGGDGSVKFQLNIDSDIRLEKLVIVDEASMLDDTMASDLLSFGIPVLALGDPAQLPPVKGPGVFASAKPDVMLTEVYRQGAGSPILEIATAVRENRNLPLGNYGTSRVIVQDDLTEEDLLSADQILVGKNDTRRAYNEIMRSLLRFTSDLPVEGDRLICLKNHERLGIFNGEMFRVVSTPVHKKDDVTFEIVPEFGTHSAFEVTISATLFKSKNMPIEHRNPRPVFDFAYAITCHKAQGSQWSNVLIIDESGSFRENKNRWLYTAITRVQNRVTIAR